MKVIGVTGASGLLGSNIVKAAENSNKVVPTHNTRPLFTNSIKLDVTDREEVFRVIIKLKPDVFVHTAAETNVDKCEVEKEKAWKVNSQGTKNIAEACNTIGAKLIYISTDYIFDGDKGFYREDDEAKPVNYYGLTKLKGESFVSEISKDYVIARASVIYGWHPWKVNFATWVIESLRHGKQISIVDDHYNSPTLANNLAEALVEIIERDLSGVYHTAGSQRINRHVFAVKIAETFGLDSGLIKPVKMRELKSWIAQRPRDSSLCLNKAQKKMKTKFLNVQESLNLMKKIEQECKL